MSKKSVVKVEPTTVESWDKYDSMSYSYVPSDLLDYMDEDSYYSTSDFGDIDFIAERGID
jgi:hypothetical protein